MLFPIVFCLLIHLRSTTLLAVTSGRGGLRKYLRRSGSLLTLRPLLVKSKWSIGAYSPCGIGDKSSGGRQEKSSAMIFLQA